MVVILGVCMDIIQNIINFYVQMVNQNPTGHVMYVLLRMSM